MFLPGPEDDDTDHAPALRTDERSLRELQAAFLADPTAVTMLEAMPGPAMVLNATRQIIATNRQLTHLVASEDLEAAFGRRPGEAMQCVYSALRPGGCGTAEHCATCGLGNSVIETLATEGRSENECRIVTQRDSEGGSLDFRVLTNHIEFGGENCVVLGLTDIRGEKRREVLERVFFHDLLNEVGGVYGLASILLDGGMEPEEERECKHDIHRHSRTLLDEIQAHREMLAAERGELAPRVEEVSAEELLLDVVQLYRHHSAAEGRSIEMFPCDPLPLRTDPAMLRRALGNLVKNALEAVPRGATVAVGIEAGDSTIRFFVRNPGVIPREVQLQIFERSFSTKASAGRGIGTYSVRLFIERHLSGKVGFFSDEERGTEFHVTLARSPEERIGDRAA